jgi:molecular chaperone IbpA
MTLNKVPYFDPFSFPGLTKSMIGSDQILKQMQESLEKLPKVATYPPYNIRKVQDNKYVIEIAVAGFGKSDIEITTQDSVLAVKGNVNADDESDYIFKGIADRAFTRTFTLADTVEVKNADLINGMLKIWLERFIPEEKKPKKVDINSDDDKPSKKEFLTETGSK